MRNCIPPAILLLLLLGGGTSGVHAESNNMNPRPYDVANDDFNNKFVTEFVDSEFFEVYSLPIETQYSQVFWTMQDPVPLPSNITKRFENKVIAITGYEVDQVMVTEEGKEVSVPITWAYNHHYCAWLISQSDELTQELYSNYKNHSYKWGYNNNVQDDPTKSTSQFFSEGNGGEFRSSYHGYPKGYAQLLFSPTHFHFNPMQIDTWNRTSMKLDNDMPPLYQPGPLPKSSRIPHSAGYSGLIECPCSDRLEKEWHMTYRATTSNNNNNDCNSDDGEIQNATECMEAAKSIVVSNKYSLVEGKDEDAGCSIVPHESGTVDVLWNTKQLSEASSSSVVASSNEQVDMTIVLDGNNSVATIHMTGPSDRWFGVAFGSTTMCLHQQSDECPQGGPYAIVVHDKNATVVEERKLDQHGPGHVLESSIQIVSNTVDDNGNRTVVLTRPLKGLTDEHYTFEYDPTTTTDESSLLSIDIIAARGCNETFAQHCGHGSTTLSFYQNQVRTPLCRAGIQGTIGGTAFHNDRCADAPRSDLKRQGNPTCSIQDYMGGLSCCHHLTSLLDKDQEIPWNEPLKYRFKFRFYFQEYHGATATTSSESESDDDKSTTTTTVAAPSHQHLTRVYWTTEAFAGEYDIPQCSPGTPPEQCVHAITSRFQVKDATWADMTHNAGIHLIYAGPHCHAPTCLSMELYNADTGELLCHVEPNHATSGDLYYETGFLAIPPCLWGSQDEGLLEPPFLAPNTTLLSIKRNNSTLPHTGEMASWQMRAVVVPSLMNKDEAGSTTTTTTTSVPEAVHNNNEMMMVEEAAEEVEMKTFLRTRSSPDVDPDE